MPGTLRLKSLSFDTRLIRNKADRATVRGLFQQSGYILKIARNSMKRVSDPKRYAPAGTPPYAHKGQIRNLMAFAVNPWSKSSVIGPQKFGGNRAPNVSEFSGVVHRRRKGQTGRVPCHYRPRPFMRPALDASLPKFAGRWASSIHS